MNSNVQKLVAKPRFLFRPHPVLGWSLTPNYGVKVRFRTGIIQSIGSDGWRSIPCASDNVGPRLAVYGCSFTYGTGLADEETFTAQLQNAMPDARILNRGIGGQGTLQNYLQFRRDIAQAQVDAAVFAIISDHRFRNIAHPQRMKQYQKRDWYELGIEHVPILRQGRAGRLQIRYVPIWQPSLQHRNFEDFLPDDHMIDTATLAVLREIRRHADAHKIPTGFVLLDNLDPDFNDLVLKSFKGTRDVSVTLDKKFSFQPLDPHPNAQANLVFAEKLYPIAKDLCERAVRRPG